MLYILGKPVKTVVKHLLWLLRSFVKSENDPDDVIIVILD